MCCEKCVLRCPYGSLFQLHPTVNVNSSPLIRILLIGRDDLVRSQLHVEIREGGLMIAKFALMRVILG